MPPFAELKPTYILTNTNNMKREGSVSHTHYLSDSIGCSDCDLVTYV